MHTEKRRARNASARKKTAVRSRRKTHKKGGSAGRKPGRVDHAKPGRRRAAIPEADSLLAMLSQSTAQTHFAALIAVGIREQQRLDFASICGRMGGRRSSIASDPEGLARLLCGISHPDRIRALQTVCEGARTHQALKAATSLRAGPMYFHLRQLERSGLLECSGRNNYRATRLGHTVLAVAEGLYRLGRGSSKAGGNWKIRRRTMRLGQATAN